MQSLKVQANHNLKLNDETVVKEICFNDKIYSVHQTSDDTIAVTDSKIIIMYL